MVSKVTGVAIAVSSSLPATYDSTGYGALTWTTVIGEITDMGELGKVWNMIQHEPLAQAYPTKLKDSYDVPDVTMTIGSDSADAGQVSLVAGRDASTAYAFKVTLPSADIFYFSAFITKVGLAQLQKGNVQSVSVSMSVVPESIVEA